MLASLFRFKGARVLSAVLALGIGVAVAPAPAHAFGLPFKDLEWYMKHIYYRLGVAHLEFTGSSEPLVLRNPPSVTSLSVAAGPLENTGAKVSDDDTLLLLQGFYIPGTDRHLALEVQLALPLRFKFYVTGRAATESLAPTALGGRLQTGAPSTGALIGRFKAFPPNFTFVYRPFVDTIIRPYIGVGALWLYTFDVNITNPVLQGAPGADPEMHFTKPLACVLQAGFDISLPLNFYITVDAKYIGCADVDAKLTGARIPTDLAPFGNGVGSVPVGPIRNTLHFESMMYFIGIGRTLWG